MWTHQGTKTLYSKRLTLRRLTVADAQEMFDHWATDLQTTKYLSWDPHPDVEATRELLAQWAPNYEKLTYYHWGIVYEDMLVGTINLHNVSERSCYGELGYCMGSRWWNLGIMTEAAGAVVDFAFRELSAHKIGALHDTENIGSGRVMQKLGMVQEGLLRKHLMRRDGTYGDLCMYGLLRDEWALRHEIAAYCSLPCVFDDFIELPEWTDGGISLVCQAKRPAIPEKKYVPAYEFHIVKGGETIGHIGLRVGYVEALYYGGNIGYGIEEAYRGHGYAGQACRLLLPVMRAHGMTRVTITNAKENGSSKRVCEKLGATLLRVAEVPTWSELYAEGQREVNVFVWEVGDTAR